MKQPPMKGPAALAGLISQMKQVRARIGSLVMAGKGKQRPAGEAGDDNQRRPLAQPSRKSQLLKWILILLVVIVSAGVFYLGMILGQPQGGAPLPDQPLLASAAAVHISQGEQLPRLVAQFPIPVLGLMEGASAELTQGSSYDTAFEQGFARILSLTYATPDGYEIQVQSIYPARAISLLSRSGFHLGSSPLYAFAGLNGVRMDSSSQIRIHAQNSQGAYVVTFPAAAEKASLEVMRDLRMYVPLEEQ